MPRLCHIVSIFTDRVCLDVLTISKLESGLFVMTPVDVQLDLLVQGAVKMFEGEAKSSGIELTLQLQDSYEQLKDTSLSIDPTRVMQVLIVSRKHYVLQCVHYTN